MTRIVGFQIVRCVVGCAAEEPARELGPHRPLVVNERVQGYWVPRNPASIVDYVPCTNVHGAPYFYPARTQSRKSFIISYFPPPPRTSIHPRSPRRAICQTPRPRN